MVHKQYAKPRSVCTRARVLSRAFVTLVKMHSFWEHEGIEPLWPFALQWEGIYWNFPVMADGLLHHVFQASRDLGICEFCATPAEWLTFVLESLKFVFLQLAVKIMFWLCWEHLRKKRQAKQRAGSSFPPAESFKYQRLTLKLLEGHS